MPSPFSPTKLTTHGPFSLLFFFLFFVFSLLPLSSSDGDLSHLRHRCCRHPKVRISSIFHPTSSSLSLVFHGFFICASSPLLYDFDRHLSGSGSGSSTVRVPPRPPSSLAPLPWPDPQPTVASLSFLLFLFPPPLPSSSFIVDVASLSPFPPCSLHQHRPPPASPFFFPFSSPMQSPTTSVLSCSRRDTGSSFPTSLLLLPPFLSRLPPLTARPWPSPSWPLSVSVADHLRHLSSLPRLRRGLDPAVLIVSPFPLLSWMG